MLCAGTLLAVFVFVLVLGAVLEVVPEAVPEAVPEVVPVEQVALPQAVAARDIENEVCLHDEASFRQSHPEGNKWPPMAR